jgi:predicted DsbA family dithiol-disulfide isomerase
MPYARAGRPQSGQTFFRILSLFVLGLCAGGRAVVIYAQAEEEVVAVVNGRKISQSEVDQTIAAQLIPLQQQIYALRETALENLILRRVLEDEARRRGISAEALKDELTAAKVEVAGGEVEQEYAANRPAFGAMSEDEAKERLRLGLETEARMRNYRDAVSRLKQRARIELSLAEPRVPLGGVTVENAPALGGKEAAVVIIEFSDFQCPFCKKSQGALKKVLQTYGDQVRLVFKHLPLEIHSESFAAARAAFCAGEQNSFWQYHDALFAADDLSPEKLERIAADLRLDVARFAACFESEGARDAVLRDVREAGRLGVKATPTFIVNGTLKQGALGFDDFSAIVARELKNSPPTAPN